MLAPHIAGDDHHKNWYPYVISMTLTAILSTMGAKLAEWVVDELRYKFGSKDEVPAEPAEKTEQ